MRHATSGWVIGTESAGRGPAPDPRGGSGRRPDILRNARILVVEDEFMVATLIEDRLLALGCDVVGPAADIEAALNLLATESLDAAVLDVNIAGRMVFPVADALADRGVPFLFATAYGAQGVASRHSGQAILDKPYNERALEYALRSLLAPRGRGDA